MDTRAHESPQGKSSSMPYRDRKESRDKRPSKGHIRHFTGDEKQPFRSKRSPPRQRVTGSFRPGFGGRFYRPRFIRGDHTFRKPNLNFRFQRYNSFNPRPRFNWRDQSGTPGHTGPNCQYIDQRTSERNSSTGPSATKEHTGTVRYSAGPSREAEKQPLLFKEESLHSREGDRELPSTVSRATARSQAIQKKRKEIERVYRQDCDTFGLVVKMLIDKDPSLDRPIQSSLKQNLQEIGLRCVEAMQQFIEDYDTREPPPSVTHRPLAQTKHKQTDISYQAQKCNSVCKLIG